MVLDEQIEERCGFQLYGRIKVLAVKGLVNLSERTFERGIFFNAEDAAVAELFLEHCDSVHGEFVSYGAFRFGVVASLGDFKLLVVVAVQRFEGRSKVADDVCNFKFFVFIHDVLLFVGEHHEYRMTMRQLMSLRLLNSIAAEFLATAFFAMRTHPERIELLDGGFDDLRVVGEDSRFEIAAQGTFHADASACQVCRADVGGFQIEYHHFEVYSRAHDAFQVCRKNAVAVEIFAEVRAGFFCMNEPHAHATLEESCELSEQRD